jgi:hypothetical protein
MEIIPIRHWGVGVGNEIGDWECESEMGEREMRVVRERRSRREVKRGKKKMNRIQDDRINNLVPEQERRERRDVRARLKRSLRKEHGLLPISHPGCVLSAGSGLGSLLLGQGRAGVGGQLGVRWRMEERGLTEDRNVGYMYSQVDDDDRHMQYQTTPIEEDGALAPSV